MPNGISCAFFAARNHVYGTAENNIFKKGIASAQTVRTVDTIAHSASVGTKFSQPVKNFFSGAAALARKIVYPLIIGSGIYNTIKSYDKVKTGVSQTTGIATMYAFEQIAEGSLKNIDNKILSSNFAKKHKSVTIAWYIAKGLAFAASSIAGYNVGSSGGEKIVDTYRENKAAQESKERFERAMYPKA